MDATQKNIMIGEVRTIRAYTYFNLALYFGDVPLIQYLLTVNQANSVTHAPKNDVWMFCETGLIFKKRSFVVGKNELWPIPQSERDLNKNLTQNPWY